MLVSFTRYNVVYIKLRFMLHEDDEEIDASSIAEFERQIVETLFECFYRILPMMTFDSLTSFPDAVQNYVSFAAFLINSHDREIVIFMTSDKRSTAFLLLDHLVHCAIHANASTGQLALRSLESLAESLWRSNTHVDGDVVERFCACEIRLIDWMLAIYVVADAVNVLADRFDAFATALLSLIRLSPERFRARLNSAVDMYPSIASIINTFLSKLTFDLTVLDRNNRRIFSLVLRDFTDELKSHVAFLGS